MPPAREQLKAAPPKWWAFVLAGLCYSLFTALAFPPAGVWVLAVFAPVPLVWAGCRAMHRPVRSALATALGVLPLWVYEQSWLFEVTQLGYPLLAIYMSLYSAAFVWIFAMARKAWLPKGRAAPFMPAFLLAPIVWTALEVIRGEVLLTGYPWYLAGHPLIESPRLAAPASLLGAYFVSFLLVTMSGALADAAGWMGTRRGMGGIGAGLALIAWIVTSLIGRVPPASGSAPTVRIGVVQTNVPQDNKLGWEPEQRLKDWMQFEKMTKEAAAGRPRPDLIIWPETMFPSDGLNEEFRRDAVKLLQERKLDPRLSPQTAFIEPLLRLQQEIGIPMLVGAEAVENLTVVKADDGKERFHAGRRFNSTFVIVDGKVREDRYDKIELTPFGEVIPYVWRWPAAQRLIEDVGAGGMKFDLTPGHEEHVFTLDLAAAGGGVSSPMDGRAEAPAKPLEFVTPICFEATKPELCRRLVYENGHRQADMIFNMSNDGWFGKTTGWRGWIAGGRQQHLQAARWRCVELGVPMIRAVNTGISAFIDRTGKIRQAGPDGRDSPVNVGGVMAVSVPIPDENIRTVFGRIGNAFGWVIVGVAVLVPFVGMAVARSRPNRPASVA